MDPALQASFRFHAELFFEGLGPHSSEGPIFGYFFQEIIAAGQKDRVLGSNLFRLDPSFHERLGVGNGSRNGESYLLSGRGSRLTKSI